MMEGNASLPTSREFRISLGNLARHESLYFFWALTEAAIIAPVFLAISPWARFWSPTQTILLLVLLMLIPFNLGRLSTLFKVSVEKQQILMVVGLIFTLVIAWRILLYGPGPLLDLRWLARMSAHFGVGEDPNWAKDLAVFLMVCLVWWRGISLIGRRVSVQSVGLRMRVGFIVVALLVVGLSSPRLERPVTPFILAYFFAVLMSVAITRVEELELSRSGRLFPMSLSWFLSLALATGITVSIAGALASFFSGESFVDLTGWLAPVWIAVRFTATIGLFMISLASVPIIIALETFMRFLIDIIGLNAADLLDLVERIRLIDPLSNELPEDSVETLAKGGFNYQALLYFLVMLAAVLAVSLALRQLFRAVSSAGAKTGESVRPAATFGPTGRPSLGRRLANRLGLLRKWRAAASVRRIYREMTSVAASRGHPRLSSETPLEYLPSLRRVWPQQTGDTLLITQAYNRVHYGEVPESEDELREILSAWERLLENIPADDEYEDLRLKKE